MQRKMTLEKRQICISFLGVFFLVESCLSLAVLTLQHDESELSVELQQGWGMWGAWQPCTRSCDGGITFMARGCLSRRSDGTHDCIGPSKKYSSCNIQDCPDDSIDFRFEQCSRFNNVSFGGRIHRWEPYTGSSVPNSCSLYCRASNARFYVKQADKVIDGTRCSEDGLDVCVDGACQKVGCDMMLGSALSEDECRECGGNGSSCYIVSDIIFASHLPKGYIHILTIPPGATSIKIEEFVPSRNYLAVRDSSGNFVLNGNWKKNSSQHLEVAGTMWYYQRKHVRQRKPESLQSLGPTTEALHINLVVRGRNRGVRYAFYLPRGTADPNQDQYSWRAMEWGECSRDCGGGTQTRQILCYKFDEQVSSYLCKSSQKLMNERSCNADSCRPRWRASNWTSCSESCDAGFRSRQVYCSDTPSHSNRNPRIVPRSRCEEDDPSERPSVQETCNHQPCPRWRIGNWSQCSTLCGEGTQARRVVCAIKRDDEDQVVPHEWCHQSKPTMTKNCSERRCEATWFTGPWSKCSSMCDGGDRTRHVMCLAATTYRPLEEAECDSATKPSSGESCNNFSCSSVSSAPSFLRTNDDDVIFDDNDISTETPPRVECELTAYGCCPDDRIPSRGPNHEGCKVKSEESCEASEFGCCLDGSRAADANKTGCDEYEFCYVTQDRGEFCGTWLLRWYFDLTTSQCSQFWYGGCHGNKNQYLSKESCMKVCEYGGRLKTASANPRPSSATTTTGVITTTTRAVSTTTTTKVIPTITTRVISTLTNIYQQNTVGQMASTTYTPASKNTLQLSTATTAGETTATTTAGETTATTTVAQSLSFRITPMIHRVHINQPSNQPLSSLQRTKPVSTLEKMPLGQKRHNLTSVDFNVTSVRARPALCSQLPTRGPCFGHLVRWYFDTLDQTCKQFAFGGCAGNKNNFKTLDLCAAMCDRRSNEHKRKGATACGWEHALSLFDARRRPQCDPVSGLYRLLQCSGDVSTMTSSCWCVNPRDGKEIVGTRRNGSTNCEDAIRGLRTPRCSFSVYGCCADGVNTARNRNQDGCPKSPQIRGGRTSIVVSRGSSARLECPSFGYPTPKIRWFKNGKEVLEKKGFIEVDGFALVFTSVGTHQVGRYMCIARNGVGLPQRRKIRLSLSDRPVQFRTRPSDVMVTSGEYARLRCRVKGQARVKWFKDGKKLLKNIRFLLKPSGDLRITKSRVSDSGRYTCVVSASNGRTLSASASLNVAKVPVVARPITVTHPERCRDLPQYAKCGLVLKARLCRHRHYSQFCCKTCSALNRRFIGLNR